jgi:hypothetical protein
LTAGAYNYSIITYRNLLLCVGEINVTPNMRRDFMLQGSLHMIQIVLSPESYAPSAVSDFALPESDEISRTEKVSSVQPSPSAAILSEPRSSGQH